MARKVNSGNHVVFAPDEMGGFQRPAVDETPESLLKREGVFFLKDVDKVLPLPGHVLKKHVQRLQAQGKDTWEIMGLRQIWNHWLVRMKTFAPYYRKRLAKAWLDVPEHWDPNQMLGEKGVFKLADVVKRLPVTNATIRHIAKTRPNAREEMGIWKDPASGNFLLEMETFGPWFSALWADRT